jgi:hypothetical protein
LIVHGFDNYLTGLYKVLFGEQRNTITYNFFYMQAFQAAMSDEEAQKYAGGMEVAAPFMAGLAAATPKGPGTSAQVGKPPQGATILQTDPNGKWVIFKDAAGVKKIQFDVSAAENVAPKPLPPRAPGKVETPQTEAKVGPDGKVYVTEGMHRLEAAQAGTVIPPENGGVSGLPGWLEYMLKQ